MPKIAKKPVKKAIKKEVVKPIKEVKKVIETPQPEIKKRGVQKGVKRGSYKKNKIEQNEYIDNTIIESEKNEVSETPQINNTIEPMETDLNEVKDVHKERLDFFLSQNSTFNPDEYKEAETQPTEVKTEGNEAPKEFDFTSNEAANGLNDFKNQNKMMVNGVLLLSICDFIFPSLIKFIYKRIDSDAQYIDTSKVKLDNDQKESLKEAANFAAVYIFEKVNPIAIFFIGMGAMYSSNFMSVLSDKKEQIKERKKAQRAKPLIKKKPIKKSN